MNLTQTFTAWRDMGPGFAALAANAPVLNNASNRVSQLQKLGTVGLEALQYLAVGQVGSLRLERRSTRAHPASSNPRWIAPETPLVEFLSRAHSGGRRCQ